GQRPEGTSDMERYPLVGDPKGDAQDVHRFSMRQGCLIEKSRLRLRRQFRIGLEMSSLVTFFAPKKVTRAPARKGCPALPAHHGLPTSKPPRNFERRLHQECEQQTKTPAFAGVFVSKPTARG
ncbi:MAG: hypothetical protein WAZ48_16530, partial [Lysobacteraceae bacterium]